jgi:hypothetical protein
MNQKTLIGILVAVIVIVLSFWYFSSMSTNNGIGAATTTSQTAVTTSTPTTPAKPAVKPVTSTGTPKTFKSIFTQTGNYECTYELVDTNSRSSSVIYISGGKMRGEFRSNTNGVISADLMIYSGGYLYSWREGASVGKKSTINSLSDLPSIIPHNLTSGAIFGTNTDNVSWDCHPWNTDSKLLLIPSYVKFTAGA